MSDKYAAQKRYDAHNTVPMKLKLNVKTDADILSRLAEQPNKQGYIKQLIRADLAAKNFDKTENWI